MDYQEHSRLAPSSMGVTVYCAGSVTLKEQYPDLDNSGEEGRASHWVAEHMFRGEPWAGIDPHGTIIDDEMVRCARFYVDYVLSVVGCNPYFVEYRVNLPLIHDICFGTVDVVSMPRETLHIFDYKYGRITIEAFENWACMAYASGFIKAAKDIVLHIVQPRPYHTMGYIRSWWLTGIRLIEEYLPVMRQAAVAALGPNPLCTPGLHCKYCSARVVCPAVTDATNLIMDICRQAVPNNLSTEQISRELVFLHLCKTLIDARATGIEAQIETNLRGGTPYMHWHLEPGRGSTGWTIGNKEIFKLGDLLGLDLKQEAKPITPIQAKDKGMDIRFFNSLTKKYPGKLKLKQIDDNYGKKLFGG